MFNFGVNYDYVMSYDPFESNLSGMDVFLDKID